MDEEKNVFAYIIVDQKIVYFYFKCEKKDLCLIVKKYMIQLKVCTPHPPVPPPPPPLYFVNGSPLKLK